MTTVVPARVRLANLWYRLARDKAGAPLYRQRPAPFYPAQVSQGDMGEAQVSPDGRTPQSLRDLSGGGGLAQQPLTGDFDRYDRGGNAEGEGLDPTLTPDGPVVLSGQLVTSAPAGNPPDGPLLGGLWHAGYERVYFASGRFVYAFDGAAVQQVGDLGAGVQATGNLVAFLSAVGATGTVYWYCPVGYGAPPRWSTDQGATWTAVDPAGDVTNVQSLVESDGEVTLALKSPRRGNAMIGVFDDGGPAPTLFGVVDPIGDAANPISRLVVHAGRVLVLKDREGVFLLTDDRRGMEEELFPELRGVRLFWAGATVWRGILWLPTEWGLYAVGPGLALQKVGPMLNEAGYVGGVAPRGPVTAVDGDAHNLYAFREGQTGPSWVYKANVKTGGGGVEDIAWFPWSQQADRARCRGLACVTARAVGAPMDAARSYLLFGRTLPQGSQEPPLTQDQHGFGRYALPGKGRDPRTDRLYAYAPAGTLYYSRLIGRFPAIDKAWYGATPLCAPLDYALDGSTPTRAHGLQLLWKTDVEPLAPPPADAYWGYHPGAVQTSGVGTRQSFVAFGRGLDLALRLSTTDPTTSPQVYAVTAEYDLRPVAVWRHEMTLDVSSGAYDPGGSQGYGDPLPPAVALLQLRSLAGAAMAMTLVDLWDNTYEVSVPVEGVALRAAGGEEVGYSGAQVPLLVDVVCTEQFVREPGTWRQVARLLWRQAQDYTWRQLQTLG